jgi:hypothetical protein
MFAFPQHQDLLWGSPSIQLNGYSRLLPLEQRGQGVELTSIWCRGREWWNYTSTPPCIFMTSFVTNEAHGPYPYLQERQIMRACIWWDANWKLTLIGRKQGQGKAWNHYVDDGLNWSDRLLCCCGYSWSYLSYVPFLYTRLGSYSVWVHVTHGLKREHTNIKKSGGSVVGIATGYGLDFRGFEVRVPVGLRIFTSPYRPDRLWDLSSLLSSGYLGVKWQGAWSWLLNLQLVARTFPNTSSCRSA